jgi:hypothetical protein
LERRNKYVAEKAQTSAQALANDNDNGDEIPKLETAENPDIETLFADEISIQKREESSEDKNEKDSEQITDKSDLKKDPVDEELIEIKINTNSSSIFSNPCVNKKTGKLKVINS